MFSVRYLDTPYVSILSLHDALPICHYGPIPRPAGLVADPRLHHIFLFLHWPRVLDTGRRDFSEPYSWHRDDGARDRKSTRLNSSHRCISYAVFCLKKKINKISSTSL